MFQEKICSRQSGKGPGEEIVYICCHLRIRFKVIGADDIPKKYMEENESQRPNLRNNMGVKLCSPHSCLSPQNGYCCHFSHYWIWNCIIVRMQVIFVSSPPSSKPCKTSPVLDWKCPKFCWWLLTLFNPKKVEGMKKQHVLESEGAHVIIPLPLQSSKQERKKEMPENN